MKLKRILTAATATLLIFGQCVAAYADSTVITLDQNATAFTKIDKDLDFRDMEPGEERTAEITLLNNSDDDMNFYISGEITYNIADAGDSDKNAIYELELNKNSETTPFFSGMIGSKQNKKLTNSNLGLEYLKDDTLIAALKKGESTTVTIKLLLDGDSTENEYMNKAGQIRLNINTSQSTKITGNTEGTVSDNPILSFFNVQTGDSTKVVLYVVAVVAAFLVVAALVIASIKKKANNKTNNKDSME